MTKSCLLLVTIILLERFELEKSQNYLDRTINALKNFLEIFTDLNDFLPGDYMLSGGKLSKDQISAIAAKWEKQRKIEHLPAELFVSGSDDKPRKYRTSDGTYVKSKSELFIYEYPTSINGKVFYPDFTIMRPSDGKIILWEHFGMMGLEGYRNQTQQKLFDYSCEGYWPFKNLITTFEFRDGDLDVSEIERILVMMEIISR